VSGNEFSYGDPLADVGTPGWARRVRVVLLDAVDGAKFTANHLCGVLDQFVRNRGWMLLDTRDGRPYRRFEDFVAALRPWGLGIEYPKFRALVMTEIGEREFDRLTASQPAQGERSDLTSPLEEAKLPDKTTWKYRAINRAPAVIKKLFDDDLLAVDVAAKFGPAPPKGANGAGHERRGELERKAEALQERVETIRVFRADLTPRKLKQEINAAAREILQLKERTREEWLRHWWKKCTAAERRKFLTEVS
jgi:hypothetical protein